MQAWICSRYSLAWIFVAMIFMLIGGVYLGFLVAGRRMSTHPPSLALSAIAVTMRIMRISIVQTQSRII